MPDALFHMLICVVRVSGVVKKKSVFPTLPSALDVGIQSGECRGRGCRASEWRAKWRARSSLISTAEAAQVVDAEDEPTISLAA